MIPPPAGRAALRRRIARAPPVPAAENSQGGAPPPDERRRFEMNEPSPQPSPAQASPIEMIVEPRSKDLGDGFEVHRVLPVAARRMVGPFVFFDQFGPTMLSAGTGLDVRPHPHIGLATVTYLLQGEMFHRDSLG